MIFLRARPAPTMADPHALWEAAHKDAYRPHPWPRGDVRRALRRESAAAIRQAAADVPSLLRSLGVARDPAAFASTVCGYTMWTDNFGMDVYYFNILDAMVRPDGVLGREAAEAVAQRILPMLEARAGSVSWARDHTGAWGKFYTRQFALRKAAAVVVRSGRARRLRELLKREITEAREREGELTVPGRAPGVFALQELLAADMRLEFLAAAKAAADVALTTAEDAAAALQAYVGGSIGILHSVTEHVSVSDPFQCDALRAVLQLCTRVAREAPDAVVRVMPKGCPGCLWLNLALPVALHRNLAVHAACAMGAMMGDSRGIIAEPCELVQLSSTLRRAYKRIGDAFPYMGNCLDFTDPYGPSAVSINNRLGALLVSRRLRRWLGEDEAGAISAVKVYLQNPSLKWDDDGSE